MLRGRCVGVSRMRASQHLDTLAGGEFGIVFPKTQTGGRGAVLPDLQRHSVRL